MTHLTKFVCRSTSSHDELESEMLSTRFTLPAAGQYTIGVFRISLVEPEKVKPTVFQLHGVLNSTE